MHESPDEPVSRAVSYVYDTRGARALLTWQHHIGIASDVGDGAPRRKNEDELDSVTDDVVRKTQKLFVCLRDGESHAREDLSLQIETFANLRIVEHILANATL